MVFEEADFVSRKHMVLGIWGSSGSLDPLKIKT